MSADIDRENLRELCERATPGPWVLTDDGLKVYALHHNGDYRKGQPVLVNRMYMQIDPCLAQGGSIAEAKTACRLIAAARTALPALLDLTDAQAAKIAELETENAGLAAGSSYDEAEAARIDEALAIFSSDLSEFETRADAVWCLVRAWENVIETLDLGDTGDDPAQRVREMVEYIDVSNAARASLESDRDQLRKQGEGQFVAGMRKAAEICKAISENHHERGYTMAKSKTGKDKANAAARAGEQIAKAILSAASAPNRPVQYTGDHSERPWHDYVSDQPGVDEWVEFRRVKNDGTENWCGCRRTFSPEFNVAGLEWRPVPASALEQKEQE